MVRKAHQITLPEGRRLAFALFGNPGGRPVVFMHGFPSSRLEAGLFDRAAASAGVSLIAPDRPGFGLSDPQAGRTVLDFADDVAALGDALGQDRLWLLGGSAGCPYALACACRLPDRVAGLAVVAGLGPTTDKDLVRRMGPAARLGFALARRAPPVFRAAFGGLGRVVARYPDLNFRLNKATPPDRETLARADIREILRASVREAFRQGTAGALHELALLASSWGFEVEGIAATMHVWHGRQDGVVPVEMAEALAKKAPRARLRLLADEGHVSLPVRHGAEILAALAGSG